MEQLKRYYKARLGDWNGREGVVVEHQYRSQRSAARAVIGYLRHRKVFLRDVTDLVRGVAISCAVQEVVGGLVVNNWFYTLYNNGQIEMHKCGSVKAIMLK